MLYGVTASDKTDVAGRQTGRDRSRRQTYSESKPLLQLVVVDTVGAVRTAAYLLWISYINEVVEIEHGPILRCCCCSLLIVLLLLY